MNQNILALQTFLGLTADGVRGPVTTAAILDAADRGLLRGEQRAEQPEALPWMAIAKEYLGTKEISGAVDNPKIVELFALAGHSWVKDDETAWCAAYVGGVLKRAGIDGTGSLAARSYEDWGFRLHAPLYGCIGVKRRAGSGWQGHVGFVVAASASRVTMLGGNQNNEVNLSEFNRQEFTAFVWPKGIDLPYPALPLPQGLAEAKTRATEA